MQKNHKSYTALIYNKYNTYFYSCLPDYGSGFQLGVWPD